MNWKHTIYYQEYMKFYLHSHFEWESQRISLKCLEGILESLFEGFNKEGRNEIWDKTIFGYVKGEFLVKGETADKWVHPWYNIEHFREFMEITVKEESVNLEEAGVIWTKYVIYGIDHSTYY